MSIFTLYDLVSRNTVAIYEQEVLQSYISAHAVTYFHYQKGIYLKWYTGTEWKCGLKYREFRIATHLHHSCWISYFLCTSGGPIVKKPVLKLETFHGIISLILRVFTRYLLRGSRRKKFLCLIYFCWRCLALGLNSGKPTHHLQDRGHDHTEI